MKLVLRTNKTHTSIVLISITYLIVTITQNLFLHILWTGVLAVALLLLYRRDSSINWFTKYSFAFFAIIAISLLWARKTDLTITGARSILVQYATICLVEILINNRDKNNDYSSILIRAISITTLLYCAYVFVGTPISDWGRVYIGDTIGVGKNAVGMRCAWGIIFSFYLFRYARNKAFYFLQIVVFAIFVAFSGSRKAILIVVIGLALIQLIAGGMKKLPRNLVLGVLIISVALYFLLSNSLLYQIVGNRMESTINAFFRGGEGDGSMQERTFYKIQAMNMFREKPLLGYGINGFMVHMQDINYWHVAYSHCNYTELLANHGIVGFLLFYIPRFYLVIVTFLKKRHKGNLLVSVLLAAMVVELIMDYELVSYCDITSQLIFCISAPLLIRENRIKNNDLVSISQ